MQRYTFALVVVCVFAIFAVFLLKPDPATKLEAELARMAPDEALAQLDALKGDIAFTENLQLMHARLAASAGNFETAQTAYGQVIDMGGPTSQMLDELAEVAVLAGDLGGAVNYKAQAQALSPNAERRQTLGYWYRLLGDDVRETELLSATVPRRLTTFERERLAELYLDAGNVDAYRKLLTAISESNDKDAPLARRQLLELNIEAGEPDVALQQALDWLTAAPHDGDGLEVSLKTFVGRGALDAAVELAIRANEINAELGAVTATVFIGTGHGGVGRRMLALWLASDPALDNKDWQVLIRIIGQTGDLSALRRALARGGSGGGSNDVPAPAAAFLQILRYQGARALSPYQSMMTSKIFEDVPLVGAAWYGWRRQPQETYAYLLAAAAGPLTDWDRAIWMLVASDLRGTPFYRELLAGAPDDAGLRELLHRGIRPPVPIPSRVGQSAPTSD